MSYSGTVTCSFCFGEGHNRRTCEKLKQYVKDNPDSYTARQHEHSKALAKVRTCSYCDETGHNRRTCTERKQDISMAVKVNQEWVKRTIKYLKDSGIGPGALVSSTLGSYGGQSTLCLVKGFDYDDANFLAVNNSYKGAFVIASPLNNMESTQHFRLPPTPEELYITKNEDWGRSRIQNVVSPVTSEEVEASLNPLFVSGHYGISELFKGSVNNAPILEIDDLEKKYFEKS